MVATMTNGQVRKTLASQIDRLDGMLDGLSDAINDTVLDAVKQAVQQTVQLAVEAAVKEVLTDPDLRKHLPPVENEPPPPAPSSHDDQPQKGNRLWNGLKRGWHGLTSAAARIAHETMEVAGCVKNAVVNKVQAAFHGVRRFFQMSMATAIALLGGLVVFHKPVLVALGVGLVLAWYFGPTSVMNAVNGALLAMVAMSVHGCHRLGACLSKVIP